MEKQVRARASLLKLEPLPYAATLAGGLLTPGQDWEFSEHVFYRNRMEYAEEEKQELLPSRLNSRASSPAPFLHPLLG